MKKALAVAAILLTFSTSAFAAPPPGAFTGHTHHSHISSSHRVHVGPPHPMHTPTGNRVRMTPTHGQTGPVGGRMSSMHHGHRHSSVHVGPRVYMRPSLPPAASASLALRRLLRTPLRLPRCMVWVPRTLLLPLSLRSLLPQILCIPRHPHQRETIKYDNVIRKKLRQQPELTLFRAKFYFPVFSSVQQRSYSSMASPTSSVHSELPM